MNRRFEMLGLGFLAVLAMSAMTASGAQALSFTSASGPVTISGEQTAGNTHVLTFGSRPITCTEVKFDPIGTYGQSVSAVKVTPTYGNCHSVILGNQLPATVTHNGCVYNVTAGASLTNNSGHVECPTGKRMQIHIYSETGHTAELCTYEIAAQTVGGITYSNMPHVPGPPTVAADFTVATNSNIATTKFFGEFVPCGGASAMATYVSEKTTFTGTVEGVPVNIDVG